MEKWLEIRKGGDFREIGRKLGIDPLIARVIRNRGVNSLEEMQRYLHGTLDDLDSPLGASTEKTEGNGALSGVLHMAEILHEKISSGRKIRVIGDYDIDGVCATYILVHTLEAFGAEVDYAIPHRIIDGYGINIHLVEQAVKDGIDTILTCDNGISAIEQVRLAKECGITVLITDHHEPQYEDQDGERIYLLPEADEIIDPKKPGCSYPNKDLCGAAVAWKLLYVYEALEKDNWQTSTPLQPLSQCPQTLETLPFASFATVGDVMDLCGENRILVKTGLQMLPACKNPGMRELISACGLMGSTLNAYHIGFVLGPCINASGRLDTALLSERLLLTKDREEAGKLAEKLTALNEERKDLTEQGRVQALALAEKQEKDSVLVLYLPGVHESIAGIVAGKVRESTNKPCIILTDAGDGEGGQPSPNLKGSGRSIEEYSMFEELQKCKDLLEKFGGHPMAAGMTLKKENLDAFRRRLNEASSLTEDDLSGKVRIDARLPLAYLSESLIKELKVLEPCGKGNEKPLFAESNLDLLSVRRMGKAGNFLKFKVRKEGSPILDAVYFGQADELLSALREKGGREQLSLLMHGLPNSLTLTVSYVPEINEYNGNRSIQLIIRNYR